MAAALAYEANPVAANLTRHLVALAMHASLQGDLRLPFKVTFVCRRGGIAQLALELTVASTQRDLELVCKMRVDHFSQIFI